MREFLPRMILFAGFAQWAVLVASALVPLRLRWRSELQSLPTLHRQMYWVYGGYVVLSIIAFGFISVCHFEELATGEGLARSVCLYVAIFWGIRLSLQGVLQVQPHLNRWWLRLGYHTLTVLFATFTLVYGWAALGG